VKEKKLDTRKRWKRKVFFKKSWKIEKIVIGEIGEEAAPA